MWTALASTILGLFSGALPELLKEFRDHRAHNRERAFLSQQHTHQLELAKIGAEQKMRESEANLLAAEMQATREHLSAIIEAQAKPTGILWIDGLNAVVRPATAVLMIMLFAWTAVVFLGGVMEQWHANKVDGVQAAQLIWGSLIGEAILATLGYVFGYRQVRKQALT